MKLGIVGLPNVGKSTLFNSLTKAGAESANYPFCTIDPNVGVVPVPDFRLKLLTDLYHSEKTTPAVIEFVDIAGLVKGDPLRDIETINLELIFSDIEILDRRIAKNGRGAANNKALAKEVELLKSLKAHLEDGKLAKSFPCDDEDTRDFINTLNLLTW